jgi:hypothetical protein
MYRSQARHEITYRHIIHPLEIRFLRHLNTVDLAIELVAAAAIAPSVAHSRKPAKLITTATSASPANWFDSCPRRAGKFCWADCSALFASTGSQEAGRCACHTHRAQESQNNHFYPLDCFLFDVIRRLCTSTSILLPLAATLSIGYRYFSCRQTLSPFLHIVAAFVPALLR